MEIPITRNKAGKTKPKDSDLGFGQYFSSHMFNMDYTRDKGWHNPRIEPFGDFSISPAAMVLHYGQAIFEGLKAYKTPGGRLQLFRPRDNFRRLNRSAKGLCIPEMDETFILDALKQLLVLETEWVPESEGTSLYVRPTVVATDPFLGVRASFNYKFFIILSPVGAYYSGGFSPVKIWVSRRHVRAVRGGVGEYKTAGNYAASLYASHAAQEKGYAQVLWLDGIDLKYIEEVGSMNIFFLIDDELITPDLSGSILPGITRASVIELAKSWGMTVSERKISIDEVMAAGKSGALKEVFGSGTAAVISPVGELRYGEDTIKIGNGSPGPLSVKLYDTITAIQYGRTDDPYGWIEKVT